MTDTPLIGAPIDVAEPAWRHVRAIDGLRGLAVVGVIAFHDGRLSGGFLGVDLFFALSGFLITGLLLKEYEASGAISLRNFWERRFRRLLPAVVTLLALLPLMYWTFGTTQQRLDLRADTPWALIYAANWHQIASSSDYWALFSDPSPLTHLWSLAIEEQFYVVWPVAFWLLVKLRRRWMMTAIVATGLVASATAMTVLYRPASPTRVYIGTDTRAFSILAGVLICLLGASKKIADAVARRRTLINIVVAGGIGLLVYSWFVAGEHSSGLFRGGLLLHSVAAAALCAAVFGSPSLWVARVLSWRPLVLLGTISYGLYLWHWPVFALLTPARSGLDPLLVSLLRYAISLSLATASFFIVERPIRSGRFHLRGARGGLVALAAASIALAVVVVVPRPPTTVTALSSSGFLASSPGSRAKVPTIDSSTVPASPATTPPVANNVSAAPNVSPTSSVSLPASVAPANGVPAETTAPTDMNTSTGIAPASRASAASSIATGAPSNTAAAAAVAGIQTPTLGGPSPAAGAVGAPPNGVDKPSISSVLWEGDSVAYDEAPGVVAALTASGVSATENTVLGFGVVPHNGIDIIKRFTDSVRKTRPSVVVYQLSNWDAQFAADLQRSSFDAYVSQVRTAGAQLVILAPPPVDLTRLTEDHSVLLAEAERLAANDPANIILLDSAQLWGSTYQRDLDGDGIPDRKADGVHICPEGAARIGQWLTVQLADHFAGVVPATPATWVTGPWSTDPRYNNPPGTCSTS